MNKELIINILLENGGMLPPKMTWYQLGIVCGVKATDIPRAKRDKKWAKKSIGRATQDVWRRHKLTTPRPTFKRRRLFYDIETSYNIVSAWRIGYNLNLGPQEIIKERAIICVSWKWEGDPQVHTLEWDKGDDTELVRKFVPILEQADEIVGHNIDRFDTKWIATRALKAGVPMSPKIKSLDTLKIAKKHFNFQSNKLDYIADFLGLGHKLKHRGRAMWDEIIQDNDPKAMEEMVHYCEKDVTLTEEVFAKIRPYSVPKMHYGKINNGDKSSCPECGEKEIKLIKKTATQVGTAKHDVQCTSCSSHFTISKRLYEKGDFTIKEN